MTGARQSIAVIGGGIAGLGAAWLLHPHHDITVYEKNPVPGGHSRTITVPTADCGPVPVDTGFIVFNKRNYPHLTRLFAHLDVPVIPSDMSFGVSIGGGRIEYGSKGLFAQAGNVLRPGYWRMLADILRFNRGAVDYCVRNPGATMRECLDAMRMGAWFRRYYLQAMGAAIWSCSTDAILDFPAQSFIRFFDNHGLLTVNGHPQWYTVKGGSREYVRRLTEPFSGRIRAACPVVRVDRGQDGVTVHDAHGGVERFDAVIFASHANETLAMLGAPDRAESEILGAFRFQDNTVITHKDTRFMPRRTKAWASWVYLSETDEDKRDCVSLSYWMNNLQSLPTRETVLVTLNPGREPREIIDRHAFSHPVFDGPAIRAQQRLGEIQGRGGCWYAGAWTGYGFHEDGLASAVSIARALGVPIPWEDSNR